MYKLIFNHIPGCRIPKFSRLNHFSRFASYRQFCTTQAAEEEVMNLNKMDYYELLQVSPSANEKELKRAYLKIAKKYHPDIYEGVNPDYFKKANEAFTTLKNPLKRKDYDKKIKVIRMKNNKDFKNFDRKSASKGFDRNMYQRMKKNSSKAREEIDPEFEEELKKYNFDRMFMEFNQRPMRSHPEELKVMEPEIFKKMSRRDIARLKYVTKRRQMDKINSNLKLRLQHERLKILDVTQDGGMDQKSYDQIVEDINRNYKQLENVEKPLQVYKTEKEMIIEKKKQQDVQISKAKRYVYPFFGIAFVINSILLIGYYYQDKEAKKFDKFDKYRDLQIDSREESAHVPIEVFQRRQG
ncbi:unnamed protein product [Moneuplotes crassus]|uniref:J domain-containing protein n=1 Tax=Euplotes crassus TaxID=5936 RepID=A0AAD2CZC4_EUPCR|nr:unnamed protein product [Moneuplotes crassus]